MLKIKKNPERLLYSTKALWTYVSVFVSVETEILLYPVPPTRMGFHQCLFSNWFHNWGQSYNLTFCLIVCFRRQEVVCWDAEQTTDRGGCLPPLRTLRSHRGVHSPKRSWRKQQRWEPLYSCQHHLGHCQRSDSVCVSVCAAGVLWNICDPHIRCGSKHFLLITNIFTLCRLMC